MTRAEPISQLRYELAQLGCFGALTWVEEDIIDKLKEEGIVPTPEAITAVREHGYLRAMDEIWS
jgi:hypothetical protein